MIRLYLVPALVVQFTLLGCGSAPPLEPAELRNEDAAYDREQCVYPAIWHDNSQICWEGTRREN
jgi:hypothetical protein